MKLPIKDTKGREWDFGDIMTVAEFKQNVKRGLFIDYDGVGHPVIAGVMHAHINVYPSVVHALPPNTTHIVWFNK